MTETTVEEAVEFEGKGSPSRSKTTEFSRSGSGAKTVWGLFKALPEKDEAFFQIVVGPGKGKNNITLFIK